MLYLHNVLVCVVNSECTLLHWGVCYISKCACACCESGCHIGDAWTPPRARLALGLTSNRSANSGCLNFSTLTDLRGGFASYVGVQETCIILEFTKLYDMAMEIIYYWCEVGLKACHLIRGYIM